MDLNYCQNFNNNNHNYKIFSLCQAKYGCYENFHTIKSKINLKMKEFFTFTLNINLNKII
jgi:aminopeptidase-like protein